MVKSRVFLLCLLMFAGTALSSVNTMELLQLMEGENFGDEFGAAILAMDYNGDGYDDLIVKAHRWHPPDAGTQNWYGKLYFFMGSPNFSSEPSYEFEGQYPYHYGDYNTYANRLYSMVNAGDLNGDGYDDLVIPQRLPDGSFSASIFFGGKEPTGIPDHTLEYSAVTTQYIDVYPLGDINGDGINDLSITVVNHSSHPPRCKVEIWTNIFSGPSVVVTMPIFTITGIGDVNQDGYGDLIKLHWVNDINPEYYFTFFYGDETISLSDSLQVGYSATAVDRRSSALGDINGDGYPDFFTWNNKVWFGGDVISEDPDVYVNWEGWYSFERGMKPSVITGDVNGDGYPDLIASCSIYWGHSGEAGIWLGGKNFNGTRDVLFGSPTNYYYRNFGWSKAAGDFNGDGYCDVAFSAPFWEGGESYNTRGRVYVYAGNPDLKDTTSSIENDIQSPDPDAWRFNIYPNPKREQDQTICIDLCGSKYKETHHMLSLNVYNTKGQQVMKQMLASQDYSSGLINLQLGYAPAGIYLVSVRENGITRHTRKMTIF